MAVKSPRPRIYGTSYRARSFEIVALSGFVDRRDEIIRVRSALNGTADEPGGRGGIGRHARFRS